MASSILSNNLDRKLATMERELVQLKTKQNYLLSNVAIYKNGPLRLTAWAVPDYMTVWAGYYSVSAIINFEGILPQKTCFGFSDQTSYGGQYNRIYTSYVSGAGSPNKMQIMIQVIGYGQFESDLFFWANMPGSVKLVEQFEFETDEW